MVLIFLYTLWTQSNRHSTTKNWSQSEEFGSLSYSKAYPVFDYAWQMWVTMEKKSHAVETDSLI